MIGVLKIRDFRLLFTGEGVSLLGDQFYFIALPWLVLELTSSTVILGVVLALQGIPRAAFMLVGGAVTDRFSPRRVMIGSNVARLMIVSVLSALVFGGGVQTWMLFVLCAAYGVADGFFYPAQTAIVPQLASLDQLSGANAFIQGLDQVAQFVGPVLAGLLIARAGARSLGLDGIGVALAIDAVTFAVSVVLLTLMRVDAREARRAREAEAGAAPDGGAAVKEPGGLWTSIREGLAYMWADPLLRVLLLLVLAVNFLAVGPLLVGVPALAAQRLPGGAQAYGAIMSAFGGGSLAGLAVAGAARRPPAALMGHVLLGVCAVFGVGLVVLGFAQSLVAALAPSALMGFAAGYLAVSFFTWIQARTPQRLMGRMMSLIIFASVGLVPVSQALSGAVASWSLTALFVGAAALLTAVVARAWFVPSLRSMGMEMASGSASAASPVPDGDEQQADEHEARAHPLRHLE
jgi:Major Facilitator Superfamily